MRQRRRQGRRLTTIDIAATLRIHPGNLNRLSERTIKLVSNIAEALDGLDESVLPSDVRTKIQIAQTSLEANKRSREECNSAKRDLGQIRFSSKIDMQAYKASFKDVNAIISMDDVRTSLLQTDRGEFAAKTRLMTDTSMLNSNIPKYGKSTIRSKTSDARPSLECWI
eukprot:IDg13607t1